MCLADAYCGYSATGSAVAVSEPVSTYETKYSSIARISGAITPSLRSPKCVLNHARQGAGAVMAKKGSTQLGLENIDKLMAGWPAEISNVCNGSIMAIDSPGCKPPLWPNSEHWPVPLIRCRPWQGQTKVYR